VCRFALCGCAGSVVLFALYELTYRLALVSRLNAPFSWAVSYLAAGVLTHGIHRRHTFRWATSYWRTLRRTAVVYGSSLTATTLVDFGLVAAGLHHRLAWLLTLLASGTVNYVALRNWGFLPRPGCREEGGPP
jgi:putative flippase GtrA